eukprot:Sspe_Gene.92995::Locus_65716_Transcript_1_1_Confidence_1.000_Length_939::g.92995::m.92995
MPTPSPTPSPPQCSARETGSGTVTGPLVMGVDAEGPYTVLYLINSRKLRIMRSDTGGIVGEVDAPRTAYKEVRGQRFVHRSAVYLDTFNRTGFVVLDIRDPSNIPMRLIGTKTGIGSGLGVVGTRLYALYTSDPCFEIYDVSDPFDPKLERAVPGMCGLGEVKHFKVVDGYDGDVIAFVDNQGRRIGVHRVSTGQTTVFENIPNTYGSPMSSSRKTLIYQRVSRVDLSGGITANPPVTSLPFLVCDADRDHLLAFVHAPGGLRLELVDQLSRDSLVELSPPGPFAHVASGDRTVATYTYDKGISTWRIVQWEC